MTRGQGSEAIEAYTLSAAFAMFADKDRGSIEPGKLADLVVFSRDILDAGERERLADVEVVMTVVGGKVVFEK